MSKKGKLTMADLAKAEREYRRMFNDEPILRPRLRITRDRLQHWINLEKAKEIQNNQPNPCPQKPT